ncbi:putative porin [Sphingomonas sp. QA11]|uniref:putative porin n=1 Tax=Sphingomonas sp. QA11 TaxID=2950605 RepID=UPI002349F42E|nr:putative porin [Sphingomonas sp. QA11]WCM28022.1 putative porin [Sphingomonas sp. QA11]
MGNSLGASVAVAALLWSTPSWAQQAAATPSQTTSSDSAMVNLVRLLVEQGVLTSDKGNALMAQAQAEAAHVRAANASAASTATAPGQAGSAVAALTPPPAGTVRVPYVPETVRAQIRDEIRQDVLAQAKAEHWAAPDQAAPNWIKNVRLTGDLRFRSASDFYAKTNSNQIVNVPEFNATGPHDITSGAPFAVPLLNATNDRLSKFQIRARIGLEATIADRFQLGFQLATGDNPGPISTNSTLMGGLRKRDIWLQLAYARGELIPGVTAIVGRFDNPLTSTDLMYDPDLAFDGAAGELNVAKIFGHDDDFLFAIRGGAFPLEPGDDNFPSRSFHKRNFRDQYIFSGQVEIGKKFAGGIDARLAGAFHNFRYLRGHVSDPCDVYSLDVASTFCSTDALVPISPTKGNTLMFLRTFDTSQQGSAPLFEPQLLGLKYAFRVLDINGSVSVPIADGVQAKLTGNFLHNFGVDPQNNCAEGPTGGPINNVSGTVCGTGATGRWIGSNEAWGGYFSIGHPELFTINPRKAGRGAWAVNAGYKRLGSDAVPDAFTDSDFHLGGTNAKGYFIGGAFAPYDNVTIGARWLSANEIVGDPFAIDVLQLDLSLAF